MSNIPDTNPVGRDSSILQAEALARWNVQPLPPAAPGAPPEIVVEKVSSEPVAPPMPVVEEKKIEVAAYEQSGRLPLAALPNDEIEKLAIANGIVVKKGGPRSDLIESLKKKGIEDVAVSK